MVENSVKMSSQGIDVQSTLLRNIRDVSSLMEAAEAAGHPDFSSNLSGLRTDLMALAGMSNGYDSRDPQQVQAEFHANGANRIQNLMQEAGALSSPQSPELGEVVTARLAGLQADCYSSGITQAPDLSLAVNAPDKTMFKDVAALVPGLAGALRPKQAPVAPEQAAPQAQNQGKPVLGEQTAKLASRENNNGRGGPGM
jgi:hypothetical protein